jgi:hypothetical protein
LRRRGLLILMNIMSCEEFGSKIGMLDKIEILLTT